MCNNWPFKDKRFKFYRKTAKDKIVYKIVKDHQQLFPCEASRLLVYLLEKKTCKCILYYENTPIQIHRKFHLQKTENFQKKNNL